MVLGVQVADIGLGGTPHILDKARHFMTFADVKFIRAEILRKLVLPGLIKLSHELECLFLPSVVSLLELHDAMAPFGCRLSIWEAELGEFLKNGLRIRGGGEVGGGEEGGKEDK